MKAGEHAPQLFVWNERLNEISRVDCAVFLGEF
jgi:hypothetical protein